MPNNKKESVNKDKRGFIIEKLDSAISDAKNHLLIQKISFYTSVDTRFSDGKTAEDYFNRLDMGQYSLDPSFGACVVLSMESEDWKIVPIVSEGKGGKTVSKIHGII